MKKPCQTVDPRISEDRGRARVGTAGPAGARTVARAARARIPQGRDAVGNTPLEERAAMASTPVWIGIDVAKAHLDIAVRPSGEQWRCAYDDAALPALA